MKKNDICPTLVTNQRQTCLLLQCLALFVFSLISEHVEVISNVIVGAVRFGHKRLK